MKKEILNKVIIVTPFPNEKSNEVEFSALGSYTKNLLQLISDLFEEVIVFSQKSNKTYCEQNISVSPIWDRNSFVLAPLQIFFKTFNLRNYIYFFQHELNVFSSNLIISTLNFNFAQLLVRLFISNRLITTIHGVIPFYELNKAFLSKNNLSKYPLSLIKLYLFLHFRFIDLFSTKIVVHNNLVFNSLVNDYKFKSSKINLIPHPLYSVKGNSKNEVLNKLLGKNKKIVMFFGHLANYKGLNIFTESYDYLEDKNEYIFYIIGSKPSRLKDDSNYNSWLDKIIESSQGKDINFDIRYLPDSEIKHTFQNVDLLVLPYTEVFSSSGPLAYSVKLKLPFLASTKFSPFIHKDFLFELTPQSIAANISDYFSNEKRRESIRKNIQELTKEWGDNSIIEKYKQLFTI